jgi:Icc protein
LFSERELIIMNQKRLPILLVILLVVACGSTFVTAAFSPTPSYYRLVVISDLHYPYKNHQIVNPKKAAQLLAAKQQALQEINSWNDVREVVLTGDIVADCGSKKEYAAAKQFLSRLHHPLSCLVGNHDYFYGDFGPHGRMKRGSVATRRLKLKRFRRTFGCRQLYFSKLIKPYLLVYLSVDKLDTGLATEMSGSQMKWLRTLLAAKRRTPTIIFFHAPLVNTLENYNDRVNTPSRIAQPRKGIDAILQANPQVLLWVSGHTHTRADNPSYNSKINYYPGRIRRILNIHNGSWEERPICTNSFYLYQDKVVVRTYNHQTHRWIATLDRTIAAPRL